MKVINNNQLSEYIIINFKIDNNENLNLDIINNYYKTISEWIKFILDTYDARFNWNFYICNLNFNIIRVFIYINKNKYAQTDTETNTLYITNSYYDFNKYNINLNILSTFINCKEFKLLLNNNNLNNDFISSDSESNSSSDYDELYSNLNYINFDLVDKDILINTIGISGVKYNTFISELNKIYLLKFSYYNNKNDDINNVFSEDIYKKINENNELLWISSYNNNLLFLKSINIQVDINNLDNINNSLLYNFINEIKLNK